MATDTVTPSQSRPNGARGGAVLPETIDRRLTELQDRVRRACAIVRLANERAAEIDGDEVPAITDLRLSLETAAGLLEEVWPELDQLGIMAPSSRQELEAAVGDDGTCEVRQLRLAEETGP